MSTMTERQNAAWPEAVAEAQRYVDTSTIPLDIGHHEWTARWEEESRPGRGQMLNAVYCDGEYIVQISMDVYGYPRVAVGETEWIHNGSDEECDCEPCIGARAEADGDQP